MNRKVLAGLLLGCGTAWAGVPPSTGASSPDTNYKLSGGTSVVVTTQPSTWTGQQTGAKWIGPTAVQSTSTHPSGAVDGNFTFTLTFSITPADLAKSTTNLTMFVLNDPDMDVVINGNFLPHFNPNTSTPVKVPLTTYLKLSNTITFNVSDTGQGPVGLNVSFTGDIGSTDSGGGSGGGTGGGTDFYPTVRVAPYGGSASTDPIDGASGQYYEKDTDLRLGGPMGLTFSRYYASQLSANGYASALGTGWMSNYDASAAISSTTAKVLLFGGTVVTFAKSGSAWTLTSPLDNGYQLAAAGTGYQLMDPQSRLVYTFDANGKLTGIQDRNGNTITITLGATGPTSVADGLGHTLTMTYTNGQLTQIQDQTGRTVRYAYTGKLLTSSADPSNNTTQYSYSTVGSQTGLLTKKQLPTGATPATQVYDATGRVTSQTDGNNNTLTIAYDGNGGTTITNPSGKITKQASGSDGNLTQLTDPNGAAASIGYDSSSRITTAGDRNGNKMAYTYHAPTGYVASMTDPQGNTTTYTYTAQTQGAFTFFNMTGKTYPDGTSTAISYDAKGNQISVKDLDGAVRSYTYDANGRATGITDSNQKSASYTYNSDGTLASVTDQLGNVSKFTYDAQKRLASETKPNGAVTKYTYDANGRQLTLTDALNAVTSFAYDANGALTQLTNALGGVSKTTYSPNLQVTSTTDPVGDKFSFVYDANSRLSSVTDAASDKVSYTYDAANRLTSVANNGGTEATYGYDAEDRVTSFTDGSGRKTIYTYDSMSRQTSFTTPGGNKYTSTFDKLGRELTQTNPLGETQSLTRDSAGRVSQITFAGGLSTKFQRDTNGYVSGITTPNGNTWSYAHDAAGNWTAVTDPLGNTVSMTYKQNVISGVTFPSGSATITTDALGNITKRQFSDGTAINLSYNALGQLASADGLSIARDTRGAPTNINGIAITYDAAARPASLLYAGGKAVNYTYDSSGRLATVSDWIGGKTTFTYDGASRIATLTYPNGVTTSYSYDADGRINKIAYGSVASIAINHDTAGKVTSTDRNLPTAPALQPSNQSFTYDAAAQLTTASYDNMGRVISQSGRKYTWNMASQLTGFQDGVDSSTFTYDGLGEMTGSTSSVGTRTFVINYLFHYPALSIVRQGSSDLRYYVYLPNGALLYSVEAQNNARHFYHFDESGNAAFLTGDNGVVTDSYAITPYGEIAAHTGTTENPFTWQGQYGTMQVGQNLYYMRSRFYDASTARFISRDPIVSGDPQTAEPYAYVGGNPLGRIDPFGTAYTVDLGQYVALIKQRLSNGADGYVAFVAAIWLAVIQDAIKNNTTGSLDWAGLQAFTNPPPPPPVVEKPPVKPTPSPKHVRAAPPANSPPIGAVVLDPSYNPNLQGSLVSNGLVLGIDGTLTWNGRLVTALNPLPKNQVFTVRGLTGDPVTVTTGSDGASLIGQDGAGMIHIDAYGAFFGSDGLGLANELGKLINQDGAGLIHQDGAGVVAQGAGNVVSNNGTGIISDNSEGVVAQGAGNVVAQGAGN